MYFNTSLNYRECGVLVLMKFTKLNKLILLYYFSTGKQIYLITMFVQASRNTISVYIFVLGHMGHFDNIIHSRKYMFKTAVC